MFLLKVLVSVGDLGYSKVHLHCIGCLFFNHTVASVIRTLRRLIISAKVLLDSCILIRAFLTNPEYSVYIRICSIHFLLAM